MLETLSIRNIVLIDELQLDFAPGLCVLTGETGAGKSILLDALGLALGERADTRLVRQGASQAQVTALFRLSPPHSIWTELTDQGIACEGQELLFRRVLESDGKSKCFLNDNLISQTLMRRLGQQLVEIHGQFDHLLDTKSHLLALDTFGKIDRKPVEEAFKTYKESRLAVVGFQDTLAKSLERQTFLRFAVEEIEKNSPRPGEEQELEQERALISHRAKLAETLLLVDQTLSPLMSALSLSHKSFSRIHDLLPEKLTPLIEASDRAIVEVQEILDGIKTLKSEVEGTPSSLEALENRLHTLRGLSRKYQTDNLGNRLNEFKQELAALDHGEDTLHTLENALKAARITYGEKAKELSVLRQTTALALETAMTAEFSPLKLPHMRFRVHFKVLPEESGSNAGLDHVEFYIQPNPGSPEGPLSAIASGGELSRLMLALKVVLTNAESVPTLIFDEIESGTGGAVAAAMGERLKKLSQNRQILTITHSPQIASQGEQHLVVFKEITQEGTTTTVKTLPLNDRYEEIARMLAGQDITDEARAAAKKLMGAI